MPDRKPKICAYVDADFKAEVEQLAAAKRITVTALVLSTLADLVHQAKKENIIT